VQTTIRLVEQPDLSAREVGTSHSLGDEFVEETVQRQFVSGYEEHSHRVIGIEPAVAC
jgi:hypothetical protein